MCAKRQHFFTFFLLMVIMDMENGDQDTKRGCLCPQDSRGGEVITPKDFIEGEG